MKLINVTIHKYKSFETDQSFSLENDITVLVGKNESGKTSALDALAKTNYFREDQKYKFNDTHDYPRKEKKRYDKTETIAKAVTATYLIEPEILEKINKELGASVFTSNEFSLTTDYDNKRNVAHPVANYNNYFEALTVKHALSDDAKSELKSIKSLADAKLKKTDEDSRLAKQQEEETQSAAAEDRPAKNIQKSGLSDALDEVIGKATKLNWNDWLAAYSWENHLKPHLPKFMYFDEYHTLPSKISINKIASGHVETEEEKTSMALLELADIDTDDLASSSSFEDFIAELEATSSEVTRQIFKYWKNNNGLRVRFEVEKKDEGEKILHIRIWNERHQISLPLSNRSKGFNWFFSFIVWFSRIQEDKSNNYILLLDEPGLNLHASAQADLLRFIEDLAVDYQIVYSTHSPFMIDPSKLNRIRTIFESEEGSIISHAIQERDPATLFPLQAALGYDIAQNLYIGKHNLVVEGVSDLVFLTQMSAVLEEVGRVGLSDKFTIIPTGGLDKVTSFISLLRGSELNVICALDSFTDQKGKARMDDLIREQIIREKNIIFFHSYASFRGSEADIEDLFSKQEYISLFNEAFSEHADITPADIVEVDKAIIPQINKKIKKTRFNHYRPASLASRKGMKANDFSPETLDRFEALFKAVNLLVK